MDESEHRLTAAVLVIGDDILSRPHPGREYRHDRAGYWPPSGSISAKTAPLRRRHRGRNRRAVECVEGPLHLRIHHWGMCRPTTISQPMRSAPPSRCRWHHPEAMALLAARYAPRVQTTMRRQADGAGSRGAPSSRNPISVAPASRSKMSSYSPACRRSWQAMREDVAPSLSRGTRRIALNSSCACPRPHPAELGLIQEPQEASPSAAILLHRSAGATQAEMRASAGPTPTTLVDVVGSRLATPPRVDRSCRCEIEKFGRSLGAVPERTHSSPPNSQVKISRCVPLWPCGTVFCGSPHSTVRHMDCAYWPPPWLAFCSAAAGVAAAGNFASDRQAISSPGQPISSTSGAAAWGLCGDRARAQCRGSPDEAYGAAKAAGKTTCGPVWKGRVSG